MTKSTCTDNPNTISNHIFDTTFNFCVILQLIANSPQKITMRAMCEKIFRLCHPVGIGVRRLHRHLQLHIERDVSHVTMTDLPHLLVGHYISNTFITPPFECSLVFSPWEPKIRDTTRPSTLTLHRATIEAPSMLQNLSIQIAPNPNTAHAPAPSVDPDPADQSKDQAATPLLQKMDTSSLCPDVEDEADLPAVVEPRYNSYIPNQLDTEALANSINQRLAELRQNPISSNLILRENEVNTVLNESSSESTVSLTSPPPNLRIEQRIQNLLKRKRNGQPKQIGTVNPSQNNVYPTVDREQLMAVAPNHIGNLASVDYSDHLNLLKVLPNSLGEHAEQLLEQANSFGNLSESSKKFVAENKAGLLYLKLKSRLAKRQQVIGILPVNLSLEEVETFCSTNITPESFCTDCKTNHEARKPCTDFYAHGPVLLSKTNDKIPLETTLAYDVIIYALTPAYRFLDIPDSLNLSPVTQKQAVGPLGGSLNNQNTSENFPIHEENSLYFDLIKLIDRLDRDCCLPIAVEFRAPGGLAHSGSNLVGYTEDFIRTLELVQRRYKGLIFGLSPIPVWSVGMDLTHYHVSKNLATRTAHYLTVFGLSANVYVLTCDIVSLPCGSAPKFFTCRRRNKRSILFDRHGRLCREGRRRLILDFSNELRYIRTINELQI